MVIGFLCDYQIIEAESGWVLKNLVKVGGCVFLYSLSIRERVGVRGSWIS